MQGLDVPGLEAAIRLEYAAVSRLRASQDWIEGPKAFAEKRKPNWKAE